MSIFCYKNLALADRLGERLQKKRRGLQLTIAELARRTRIAPKHLSALEQSNFTELPKAKAFRLAYVREYATALSLKGDECVEQFTREDGLSDAPLIHPHRAIRGFPFASVSLFLRNALVLGGAALFAGYLLWQVRGVLEPPRLVVYSPIEGQVSRAPVALVQGETEPETRLTVNGQNIMVNDQGAFETKIDLSTGLNTIIITAEKKHGKTTAVTRHLVVQQKNKNEQLTINN
ncbi:MAG: Transcriptional regulator, XRE family [Candidatus Kaiserbacteria bacterium GW2011_GWA2_49_19]|uniref:Transcriptional regulator, XRE family n=1 Tax=Candidatus Kaiserbacteria bacterium GW2011_GWA2_49_19 TaxID=1618669 RepID=A0A0G1Y367_9BACT|nr:MAG: Transcriptional regulator, XRE family [Candidatus Kaiserbacteria bacterium GW2011_GWA2_49_19]